LRLDSLQVSRAGPFWLILDLVDAHVATAKFIGTLYHVTLLAAEQCNAQRLKDRYSV
jgi:hypothetical protein